MKTKELKALHEKTVDELQAQLSQLQEQLAKSSLELKAGKLDDLKQPRKIREGIAQIKTIIREKELLAAAKTKLVSQEEETA